MQRHRNKAERPRLYLVKTNAQKTADHRGKDEASGVILSFIIGAVIGTAVVFAFACLKF
ncbi:hypothetical protein PP175_09145 [Aneurinibacillus sp. Ricciae_BoGa-3]|uniref:hypothetical protein n=1 Tax=Aneurinibacillus sp. Ricciae_BoGa-3 TaxID=3022697 RepID=UPI002340A77B|nr:hypothetical protein [Aneurinibacillus sp. Ricciae_BoGa-3]WCK56053.1 hypothetical protein PP175_09145 [Aneurinibacillus sp. Ricciae_BoGa-3]